MTGEKAASSGRTLSRESGNKNKEESSSSIKSLWRGDKKKKMKIMPRGRLFLDHLFFVISVKCN
jgi:hypothetical protein